MRSPGEGQLIDDRAASPATGFAPGAALHNFLYLVGGHVFYKVLALLMLVLIARYFGGHDFGRFAVAFAAVQLADMIADVGLSQVVVRESAGRPATLARDLVALVPIKLALGVVSVAVAIGAVVMFTGDADLAEIALYLAIAQALSSLTLTLRAVFQAFERMEYEALSVSLEGWIRLGAVLFAISGGYGVLGVAKLFALASFIVLAATLVVVIHRFVQLRPALLSWTRAGELLVLGVPFSVVWLLFGADQRLNTLLMASLAGRESAGIFSAAMRLIEPTLIVPTMLTIALFPVVARHDRAGLQTFRLLVAATHKALLVLAMPLAIIVLFAAPELVLVLFGPEFARAAEPLRLAAPTIVLLFLRVGLAQTLLATGRWRAALAGQAFGLATDLAVALVAIPAQGLVGGVMALIAGHLAAVGASLYALRSDLDRDVLLEITRPIVVAAPSIVAGAVLAILSPLAAIVGAAVVFVMTVRVVRIFSVADARYMRSTVAPLAAVLAFASVDET